MTAPTVVVGAGITGLAAAHDLVRRGRDVIVLEASAHVGGKIKGGPVGGAALPFEVDEAADGFLAREPEMTDLCVELGLGDRLTSPRPGGAFLWVDGGLRRIPPSVLGAPLDPEAVAASGIVGPSGVAALVEGLHADLPPLEGDASVGAVLRPRLGDEVVARMVDPLLGGINAGSADRLSIRSGAAALADAAARGGRFIDALRAHVAAARPGPVFHGVEGGSRLIVQALVDELGDRIRTDEPVTALTRTADGWTVHGATGSLDASRVVLTTPAWVTADLLASHAPEAATRFAALEYADAVLVTFVARRAQVAHELDGAGFLVPRDQDLLMTATSISSSKWSHYDDGDHVVLRVSAGRTDDPRWTQRPIDDVVATLRAELEQTIGLTGPTVHRVSEWRRCLPQYRPGHLDRCDRIDEVLASDAPGVVVAGASMRGLGLPACVRQGRAAVRDD